MINCVLKLNRFVKYTDRKSQKSIGAKKSGAGTDSLYKPKLIWFNRANTFLNEVTSTRESSSNLVSFIFIIHFTIHFSFTIFIHLVYMVFNY